MQPASSRWVGPGIGVTRRVRGRRVAPGPDQAGRTYPALGLCGDGRAAARVLGGGARDEARGGDDKHHKTNPEEESHKHHDLGAVLCGVYQRHGGQAPRGHARADGVPDLHPQSQPGLRRNGVGELRCSVSPSSGSDIESPVVQGQPLPVFNLLRGVSQDRYTLRPLPEPDSRDEGLPNGRRPGPGGGQQAESHRVSRAGHGATAGLDTTKHGGPPTCRGIVGGLPQLQ